MERPEIYTDNYNSLEEWIELRKRNEEFVYPQFFVPFREWMKDIEQKSDMEIKELLRILLQPYTLGVDTVDTYEFYKEYVQDKVNKEKNLQTYELCMNQLKYNERIYRIKNKQEAWEGDMYPFYWTSSERGIFMRYTYEFKKKAVELYRQGKWIDAPNDIINLKNFHDMIVRWHHLEESNTSDCLKHYGTNKKWSPEEKYELVARVIAGDTITSVAYTVGINSGLLAQWIRKYKIWGYNGLVGRRKGRKPKESAMKKMNINNPRKLNESEYEELIRLRAEITYIKAENEAIKKEIALREEREAALLKAKKQQSSKNSKKKDIC